MHTTCILMSCICSNKVLGWAPLWAPGYWYYPIKPAQILAVNIPLPNRLTSATSCRPSSNSADCHRVGSVTGHGPNMSLAPVHLPPPAMCNPTVAHACIMTAPDNLSPPPMCNCVCPRLHHDGKPPRLLSTSSSDEEHLYPASSFCGEQANILRSHRPHATKKSTDAAPPLPPKGGNKLHMHLPRRRQKGVVWSMVPPN